MAQEPVGEMFSLEELWVRLSTSEIGFYTYRRADKIPASPGVYAWFLPLWLRESAEQLLTTARLILCYDAPCGGPATWETEDAGFRWDPLHLRISRRHSIAESEAKQQLWKIVADAPMEARRRFRLALMAATIFVKPLYVGLSNDLLRRYGEHTKAGSSFRERFNLYMKTIDSSLTVADLLFVCIPLRVITQDGGPDPYTDPQIQALEHILKLLCQPAFGDV